MKNATVLFCTLLACFGSLISQKQSTSFNPSVPKNAKLDTVHVHGFKPVEVMQIIDHKGTNPVIIDVRSNQEFIAGHIKGAVNIPLEQLEQRLKELKKYKKQTIIAVCETGVKAMQASGILTANKFGWAFYMKTGLEGWRKANLPIEH